ncbi:FtsX-like permease family protein [uncultured Polaribacter sp.]|uniref:ABC transporter permease n=1 Tax=uncultured Polaribacter sp. TaxID=174711 RepID=UPI00261C674E|nr:FtsX-like permease family protein [uncultured Polaribacter sp.]
MKFSLYIAKRYLFSKTSNNAINIITIIASFGVIVGTLALFIVLSGLSGLRTFSYNLLDISDPDIKITSLKGKSFLLNNNIQSLLDKNVDIKENTKVIEERVFLEYKDKNEIAFIKGVDENYTNVTKIDSAVTIGTWLDKKFQSTAVIGEGISRKLSLGILNFGEPLSIMIPKPGKGFINPSNAFYTLDTQITGVYSGTEEFTNRFIFVQIDDARRLLRYKANEVTGIELKLADKTKNDDVSSELQKLLGKDFKVQTKEQLNEVYFKVLNTETFVIYLIFTLIIIIALFNLIGAIIMMIIDKKSNLKTLHSLGTSVNEIKNIFVFQGFLLTVLGMVVGLILGIILVLLQKQFGLFMITQNLPYPVEFTFFNLLIVMLTIIILGYVASKVASSRISKEFIER